VYNNLWGVSSYHIRSHFNIYNIIIHAILDNESGYDKKYGGGIEVYEIQNGNFIRVVSHAIIRKYGINSICLWLELTLLGGLHTFQGV